MNNKEIKDLINKYLEKCVSKYDDNYLWNKNDFKIICSALLFSFFKAYGKELDKRK